MTRNFVQTCCLIITQYNRKVMNSIDCTDLDFASIATRHQYSSNSCVTSLNSSFFFVFLQSFIRVSFHVYSSCFFLYPILPPFFLRWCKYCTHTRIHTLAFSCLFRRCHFSCRCFCQIVCAPQRNTNSTLGDSHFVLLSVVNNLIQRNLRNLFIISVFFD